MAAFQSSLRRNKRDFNRCIDNDPSGRQHEVAVLVTIAEQSIFLPELREVLAAVRVPSS